MIAWLKKLKKLYAKWRKWGVALPFVFTSYKAFDYRERYLSEESKNEALIEENIDLKAIQQDVLFRLTQDNYSIDDIVFPMWYKVYEPVTDDFRMVRMNKAYRKAYGVSDVKYFGKSDDQVLGSEIGEQYQAHDRITFNGEEGQIHQFYENYVMPDGTLGIGKFAKWKVVKDDNIYIFGMELER